MNEKIIKTKEEKWTKEKTKHKINKKISTTLAILVTLSIPIIITAKQNNNINTINVSKTIAKSPETKEEKEDISNQNNQQNQTSTAKFIYEKNNKSTISKQEIQEYQNMPKEIKGEKVIGKLEIPSIKLETYIIGRTTKETLNISVTKLSGPEINQIGNFCITGHNYPNSKMFFKLHKVKTGEEIILTSPNEQSTKYKIYEVKEVLPKETEVLSQETKQEKEVTLITCTFGARKRLVVKAAEVYD